MIRSESNSVNVIAGTNPIPKDIEFKVYQDFMGGRREFCAGIYKVEVFVSKRNAGIQANPERVKGGKKKMTSCGYRVKEVCES